MDGQKWPDGDPVREIDYGIIDAAAAKEWETESSDGYRLPTRREAVFALSNVARLVQRHEGRLQQLFDQSEPCTEWGEAVEDRLHALEGKIGKIDERFESLEPQTPLDRVQEICAHHSTRLAAGHLADGTPLCRLCFRSREIEALRTELEVLANFVTGTVPAKYIEEGSDVARIARRHDDLRRVERREADDER